MKRHPGGWHRRRGVWLRRAIARRDWEMAALLLMLGASRALAALPPGTVDDVLALLGAGDD
jgi:hypothetical protein